MSELEMVKEMSGGRDDQDVRTVGGGDDEYQTIGQRQPICALPVLESGLQERNALPGFGHGESAWLFDGVDT